MIGTLCQGDSVPWKNHVMSCGALKIENNTILNHSQSMNKICALCFAKYGQVPMHNRKIRPWNIGLKKGCQIQKWHSFWDCMQGTLISQQLSWKLGSLQMPQWEIVIRKWFVLWNPAIMNHIMCPLSPLKCSQIGNHSCRISRRLWVKHWHHCNRQCLKQRQIINRLVLWLLQILLTLRGHNSSGNHQCTHNAFSSGRVIITCYVEWMIDSQGGNFHRHLLWLCHSHLCHPGPVHKDFPTNRNRRGCWICGRPGCHSMYYDDPFRYLTATCVSHTEHCSDITWWKFFSC